MRLKVIPSLDGVQPMELRFFPLYDNSQLKETKEDGTSKIEGQSLFELNQLGWTLKFVGQIQDVRDIAMQVAVLSYSEWMDLEKSMLA